MKKRMMKIMCCLVFGGAFLFLLPPIGSSQSQCTASVGSTLYTTIQSAINASFGVTIVVSGTCNENIQLYAKALTLDGGGTAKINGVDASQPTVAIYTGNSIRGFTITGGMDGILVARNSLVRIYNNTIASAGRHGIFLVEDTSARIYNNTIQRNLEDGILVNANSTARIGFDTITETVASPNRIENNGGNGITVLRSSSAIIVGNTINDNGDNGIKVAGVSQADISDNTINGNYQNGILVTQNSGVNLGNDTGGTIYDLPNDSTIKNGLFGLMGEIGGYAVGRLGTLDGLRGPVFFNLQPNQSSLH